MSQNNAEPPETIDPQAMLCFNLYAVSHAFNRFYQPILDPLGITYPQYLVLLALRHEDKRGVGSLGRELMLDTNTLSPLLKRMEIAGLVGRTRQADDERRVLVHLTERGQEIAARAAQIPDCILSCLDMPESDLQKATEIVARLRRMLADIDPPKTPA
jgi:MarR family transcriptional regulator, organic hydroperoxide resistance regulator